MTSTTYLISVETADGPEEAVAYAYAYGDLPTMQYITRRVDATLAGVDNGTTFKATLGEVARVGSSIITRVLAAVTGDADVVAYVLRKKVAAERKANSYPEPEPRPEQGDDNV